ncbi:hypothetical protein INR77_13400 [Erythrobacter sp. SCSIO 43205]|uniref:hypothetical protein n=1 Tax=Erythrobacter sp. SCSIO 43205 TaxID=2779361 RepID=UPI001CAA2437|nr:hypothetical protein [Erythrobacter sp. SCSIO 43205]UAB77762.1 hypothetical protein INR77_13400 [Erythrobacter sp. SCSIO 43205]
MASKHSKPVKRALKPLATSATNIALVEIVLRALSYRFRDKVESEMVEAANEKRSNEEEKLVDGHSLITSIGLYGAAKLAAKSPAGLGIVAGGLVLKTLYDRGKSVRARRAARQIEGPTKVEGK